MRAAADAVDDAARGAPAPRRVHQVVGLALAPARGSSHTRDTTHTHTHTAHTRVTHTGDWYQHDEVAAVPPIAAAGRRRRRRARGARPPGRPRPRSHSLGRRDAHERRRRVEVGAALLARAPRAAPWAGRARSTWAGGRRAPASTPPRGRAPTRRRRRCAPRHLARPSLARPASAPAPFLRSIAAHSSRVDGAVAIVVDVPPREVRRHLGARGAGHRRRLARGDAAVAVGVPRVHRAAVRVARVGVHRRRVCARELGDGG